MADIIIVDDEEKICTLLVGQLKDSGHRALGFTDPLNALSAVEAGPPDILITDLRMEGMDGITLLKRAKKIFSEMDVIMMTAYATVETALEAMREGAYDYIIKPFKTDELLHVIQRIEEKHRLEAENIGLRTYLSRPEEHGIVGSSPAMSHVRKLIDDLAGHDAPVLIRGESGTGKELVASAIHRTSRWAAGPFIAINCAAIPETLLESELFGYDKGAFTGATRRKLGHFQLANRGSLFLDEIGDLPASLQAKLLRVIENRRITPLGSEKEVQIEIRLISATNRPIEDAIKRGRFREDLFYRLNVFPITIPPLRERREDIRDLASHFLSASGRDAEDLSEEALRKLLVYNWPGNVRELRNVLERAVIVRPRGRISAADLQLAPLREEGDPAGAESDLNLENMEKKVILRALKLASGNKSEAARLLGITRRALYGRLERYGMDSE